MGEWDRRRFLAGLSSAIGWRLALPSAVTFWSCSSDTGASRVPSSLRLDAGQLFDLSVASGDPSATGVVLWTHLSPSFVVAGQNLHFQVALDAAFNQLVVEGQIDSANIGAAHDYTARVDLDGWLAAGNRYHYRFVYGDVASATGRCRTLPGGSPGHLKLALLTCQDYTNGYYGTFRHIAADDSIDFVVHLGDIIYESVGDPRFQDAPFADRQIVMPSGSTVALGLADYRALYRTYRGDPAQQRMLEQHTLIAVSDDHETANDCYWDYARDTLGAPDHPFKADAAKLKQLKLESQRAWVEYVPARVVVNEGATHPHDYLRFYRDFAFGDLARLVMIDTRTYRTPHPCGEGDVFQRYLPVGCDGRKSPSQSLLGATQRAWMLDRLGAPGALWNLLGNQTYLGRLSAVIGGAVPIDVDAWDGYEAERRSVSEELRRRGVKNLVVMTGDLHSYLASHVKVSYDDLNPFNVSNTIGVEFMTPSVTSAVLFDALARDGVGGFGDGLAEAAVRLDNPHISYFNSSHHGYSTLELGRGRADWVAYSVDRTVAGDQASRLALAHFRKTIGFPYLTQASTAGF
jgi:alkaline phosphatase D